MKSHINLISRDVLFDEKPFPFRQIAFPIAAAAGIVVLGLASTVYLWRVGGLRKDVRQLTAQHDKVRQELALLNGEISGLTHRTDLSEEAAARQRAAMSALLKDRIPWSDFVREVSFIMPEGVWLTRMESLDQKSGGLLPSESEKALRFVGIAQSQNAVNRFIAALERSPRYGHVSLVFVHKGTAEEGAGMIFEVTGDVKPSGG
ncbi:MAG TPA: PilN domain-containing protein [Nitrospiria bacterium]